MKNVNNIKTLFECLKGRKEIIVFVTGPTGAGKSTVVGNLSHALKAVGVHPGRAVRRNKEYIKLIKESSNPSAPHVTENFIRKHVENRVKKAHDKAVIIDGLPRSFEQVTWCVDLAMSYDRDPIFVYVSVPVHIRMGRLSTRDQEGDKELMQKKLHADEQLMPPVIQRIQDVVIGGKFGMFYEVFNRRDDDFYKEKIDGSTKCFL